MPPLTLDCPQEIAEAYITARMCFPRAEDNYRRWMARALLDLAAETQSIGASAEEIEGLGGWLGAALAELGDGWRLLANATSTKQSSGIAHEAREQLRQGVLVGHVLSECILKRLRGEPASLKTERELFTEDKALSLLRAAGLKPIFDPKSLERTHRKFRPVAHLWAAYVAPPRWQYGKARWLKFGKFPGGLRGFLNLAEEFLEAAQKPLASRGPRAPILSKEDAWRIEWKPPHSE